MAGEQRPEVRWVGSRIKGNFLGRETVVGDALRLFPSLREYRRELRGKKEEFVFKQTLTENNIPLQLQALAAENPEFAQDLQRLISNGTLLEYQEYRRTPHALREAFARIATENGDLRRTVATALVEDRHVETSDAQALATVLGEIGEFMKISSPTQLPIVQEAVRKLNEKLAKERAEHAKRRLLDDRTDSERGKVLLTAGIAVGAGVVAGGLQLAGAEFDIKALEGAGMAVAGQADDVTNAIAVGFTENGGKKDWRRIITDNKATWLFVVGAIGVDLAILPTAFATATGIGALALASLGYWATATAGSAIAEASNMVRNFRSIRKHDKEGKLAGKDPLPQELLDTRNKFGFQWQLKRLQPDASITAFVAKKLEKSKLTPEQRTSVLTKVSEMEQADRGKLLDSLKRGNVKEDAISAFHETMSNPYRSWLFRGLGASAVASVGAGLLGLLPGRGILTGAIEAMGPVAHNLIHGLTEAFIGPMETFTAIFGSEAEAKRYDKKRTEQLTRRARFSPAITA